ncbi:MAG: type I methionyl aminopeptidase [Candidatus Aminicenantes bacterium]|nr:type I methionyl aminopeptidase [Candidatus Aminicenantes bacterium]
MIIYKTDQEIRTIKKSCQIVAQILYDLGKMVKPGISTRELDSFAEKQTLKMGAVPAFKGYRGYPATLCTSINEEIVHGIPSSRTLREGDIISLDFGVIYDGYFGDAARTYPVGEITPRAKHLIETAKKAFYKGMSQVKSGNRLSDISHSVQQHVEDQGFSVIRSFVGHGIGLSLHEEPQIPNFGPPGRGPKLKPGMVLALEPMISIGGWEVEILSDNWTAVTKDRSLSAHFEHTIALTQSGAVILSQWQEEESPSYAKESQYV